MNNNVSKSLLDGSAGFSFGNKILKATDPGVYRTPNGGINWNYARDGIPFAQVIRPVHTGLSLLFFLLKSRTATKAASFTAVK